MRIHTTAQWLLIASLSDAAMDNSESSPLTFLPEHFSSNFSMDKTNTAIFVLPNEWGEPAPKVFSWHQESSITVQNVNIYHRVSNSLTDMTFTPYPKILNVQNSTYIGGKLVGNVTLDTELLNNLRNMTLPWFLSVNWTRETMTRDDAAEEGIINSQELAVVENNDAASSIYYQYSGLTARASPVPTNFSKMTTTPPSSTATATSGSDNNSTATAQASTHSKATSIATGAIAGIVVGAVALLTLTGCAVWFLCSRRRRRHGDGVRSAPHSGRGQTTQNHIAEKEANAGVVSIDSSHSPYTEDAPPQHYHMSRIDRSGVDLGMSDRDDSVHSRLSQLQLNATTGGGVVGGSNRNSVTAGTIGAAAGIITADSPRARSSHERSSHERSSLMGSPVPPTPARQEPRTYTAYPPSSPLPPPPGTAISTDDTARLQQQHFSPIEERHPSSQCVGDDDQHANTAASPRPKSPVAGERALTPSEISGRYAHLVEEGMTEDEIRRLEDEELQIDMAIAQAGRRR